MANKNEIVQGLIKAYWAEIETVMNYISHSVNLDGVRAEEIKKALTAEIADELGHAQMLAKRVKELGSTIPGSAAFKSEQSYMQPATATTDVVHTIKGVIEAEKTAISHYKYMIKLCDGDDYVTQDLCVRLLADEEAHRSVFEGYLKEY